MVYLEALERHSKPLVPKVMGIGQACEGIVFGLEGSLEGSAQSVEFLEETLIGLMYPLDHWL
jgi:hypothetical protein